MNKHNIQQDIKKKTHNYNEVCVFVWGLIYTETEH